MSGPFNPGDVVMPSVTRLDVIDTGDDAESFVRDGYPGPDFPLSAPPDWQHYIGHAAMVIEFDPIDHTVRLRHSDDQSWWWPAEGVVLA